MDSFFFGGGVGHFVYLLDLPSTQHPVTTRITLHILLLMEGILHQLIWRMFCIGFTGQFYFVLIVAQEKGVSNLLFVSGCLPVKSGYQP